MRKVTAVPAGFLSPGVGWPEICSATDSGVVAVMIKRLVSRAQHQSLDHVGGKRMVEELGPQG
jgi:hypothetical protein